MAALKLQSGPIISDVGQLNSRLVITLHGRLTFANTIIEGTHAPH